MEDVQVIEIVNRNHDLRQFTDRLSAISARRRRKRRCFIVQTLCKLWCKS